MRWVEIYFPKEKTRRCRSLSSTSYSWRIAIVALLLACLLVRLLTCEQVRILTEGTRAMIQIVSPMKTTCTQ